VSIRLATVRIRLAHQRRAGASFDQAWKMAVKGAKGPTYWALWETKDAWQRAYDRAPMQDERGAAVLAQLPLAQTGLVHDQSTGRSPRSLAPSRPGALRQASGVRLSAFAEEGQQTVTNATPSEVCEIGRFG
jgi:hypothetical protein